MINFFEIVELYSNYPYLAMTNQGWNLSSQKIEPLYDMSVPILNTFYKHLKNVSKNELHNETSQLLPNCYLPLKEVEQNLKILIVKQVYRKWSFLKHI